MHNIFPDWLTSARTIAIVGFGREGKSTNQFLQKNFPDKKVFIFESHQETFEVPPVDVVFKSPGIPSKNVHCAPTSYLTSQTDLFVQMFGTQTIAITGTKGKSTTAHAIAHVLTSIGHEALLVGNIGKPALDYVELMHEETTAVFEMSAFQTESLHSGVHISVFTSLYQDHLDYYNTLQEYYSAKKHLFDLQSENDICIYRDDYPEITTIVAACAAQKVTYNAQTDSLGFPINYVPALLIARRLDASEKQIRTALSTLKPLPGRLEKIAEKNGVSFYDDALATIPEATINALDALGDDVKVLIAGGHDRNQDFTQLAHRIAASKILTVLLFPQTGERIAAAIAQVTPETRTVLVDSMKEAVETAYETIRQQSPAAKHTQIVLLSAASPSFGLFKDYKDRSTQYKHWVDSL